MTGLDKDLLQGEASIEQWRPTEEDIDFIHEVIFNGDEELKRLWSSLRSYVLELRESKKRSRDEVYSSSASPSTSPEEDDEIDSKKPRYADDIERFMSFANSLSPNKYRARTKRKSKKGYVSIETSISEVKKPKMISPGLSEFKKMFSDIAAEELIVDESSQQPINSKKTVPKPKCNTTFKWPSRAAKSD